MGNASNARRRRAKLVVATALSLAASSATIAADPAKSVDGLLQFSNVRVINAPQVAAATSTAPLAGMRAYKDSATGALRGPTAEEMQAASTTTTAGVRSASTDADASTDKPSFVAAGGAVGVVLDDSFLQYSTVVRESDGSLKEICVTGSAAADAIVKHPSVAKKTASKEIPNVR